MQRIEITTLPNAGTLPLSVADAKSHARIEIADDDALIQSYILAACKILEQEIQKRVIQRQFRLWYDCAEITSDVLTLEQFNSGISINAFTTFDENDAETTVDASLYSSYGNRVSLKSGFSDIAVRDLDSFKIEYTVLPAPITENIKQALRMLVAHWYENREAEGIQDGFTFGKIPFSVKQILATEKIFSV